MCIPSVRNIFGSLHSSLASQTQASLIPSPQWRVLVRVVLHILQTMMPLVEDWKRDYWISGWGFMEARRSQKHFHLNPDDELCCGDWYSTGLLRQIAKVLQHASGTVENYDWFTTYESDYLSTSAGPSSLFSLLVCFCNLLYTSFQSLITPLLTQVHSEWPLNLARTVSAR